MEQIEQKYLRELSIVRRVGQTIKWGSVSLMASTIAATGIEATVYSDSKRTVLALGTAMLSSFGLILGVGLESIADNEEAGLVTAPVTSGQIEQNRVN